MLIMLGFLFQWPTLLTLLMFPALVSMYYRLAIREERDSREAFGEAWDEYAARTPRFFPRFGSRPAVEAEVMRDRSGIETRAMRGKTMHGSIMPGRGGIP